MEQINIDYYKADFVKVNVGWRPTTSDTLPMIGATGIANLLVATGTKRDGLHCSPVIANYLSDLILTGRSALELKFDAKLFAPDRKPHKIYSRAEAVETLASHMLNAAYQHDFVPAKNNMAADLLAHYRKVAEDLHDSVGAKDWGIPPELKDMFRYGHLTADSFR